MMTDDLINASLVFKRFGRHSSTYSAIMKALDEDERMWELFEKEIYDPGTRVYVDYEEKGQTITHADIYLFLVLLLFGGLVFKTSKNGFDEAAGQFTDFLLKSRIFSLPKDVLHFLPSQVLLHLREEFQYLKKFRFRKEDIFQFLYQDLLVPDSKKRLGIYLTPPSLANLMINRVVDTPFQEILDPACGTGVFLIEALQRKMSFFRKLRTEEMINILKSLHGFDVHPNAVLSTTINLLLHALDFFDDVMAVPLSIKVQDALSMAIPSEESKPFFRSLDVVIGNPPWKVLNSFRSKEVKEKLKKMAKMWRMLPPSHQISHMEISGLFLQAARHWYLRPGGKVFLVLSHSILTGNNHCKTRAFDEFEDIECWLFDEQVFPIPFCCILARYAPQKNRTQRSLNHLKIKVVFHERFPVISEVQRGKETKNVSELVTRVQVYVPSFVEKEKNGYLVGRFVPIEAKKRLTTRGRNYYHARCYAGATLFPRNLLFVTVINEVIGKNKKKFASIQPMVNNAKKPWDFNPFHLLKIKEQTIESEYLFSVITSQEILPFFTLPPKMAFLPIEKDEVSGGYKYFTKKDTFAWKYYQRLEKLYAKYRKASSMFTTLWKRLDYQQCLTSPRQRQRIRVLMPQSGQRVKAAVLMDPNIVVDYTSYQISCESEDEAFYLCGILNSSTMNGMIRLVKADRHIQKRPLEFKFPKFNPLDELHQEIADESRKIMAQISRWINKMWESGRQLGRTALQKRLLKEVASRIQELDVLVALLFES